MNTIFLRLILASAFLLIVNFKALAFEGIYSIEIPLGEVFIEVDSHGQVTKLESDMLSENSYSIMSTIVDNKLDMTISWQNDGSPELSRIIFFISPSGRPQIEESFTVLNDGDPILGRDRVTLSYFEAI